MIKFSFFLMLAIWVVSIGLHTTYHSMEMVQPIPTRALSRARGLSMRTHLTAVCLWPGPKAEVRNSRTSGNSVHAQRKFWRFWLVLVSIYCVYKSIQNQSHPQRLRSFWSAPRIATSGQVQRHSGFEWICKHNRLSPEPIRFVRLDSEHAQSEGSPWIADFRCWTWPEVAILGADQKERGLWGTRMIQNRNAVGPLDRAMSLDLARGSTAVKWVRMLKPHARDRARLGMGCTISIETNKRQNGGGFKFRVFVFISRG